MVEVERARLPRVGRPIDMLSADNPHAEKRIPERFVAENYEHWKGNSLYEHQHTKGVDEDDWEDAMMDNFSMDEYTAWKKNLTKEKFDTLKGMLAYENKQQLAQDMLERLPKDKRNYLHVKIKRNPGHYSQTLVKELQGEDYDSEKWMSRQLEKEYGNGPLNPIDTISAPAARAIYKTNFVAGNAMDSLLYQRERHVMTYTDYNLYREQLEEEGEEKSEQNAPTYYETRAEDGDLPSYELENVLPEDEDAPFERYELTDEEYETQMQEIEMTELGTLNTMRNLKNNKQKWAQFDRQNIRDMQDSIGPKDSQRFDMPSLDLKRDLIYEEGRVLRNEVVFDQTGGEEVYNQSQLFNFPQEVKEKAYALSEMLPPDPEEEPTPEFKELVEEEFGLYIEMEQKLVATRSAIAKQFMNARELYEEIDDMRHDLILETRNYLEQSVEYQPHPKPLYDIMGIENKKQIKADEMSHQTQLRNLKRQMNQFKFNPTSKRVSDFERELLFLSKAALLGKSNQSQLQQFDFVFDCLKKQGIRHSTNIKSRIFEYAVLNRQPSLANSVLRKLADESLGNTPIQPKYLQKYFDQCLLKDNFDGVAYLTNYCDKHQVPLKDFDLSKFHNAVNHYLNVDFNLSKVMIFTKFYTKYYEDRQAQILRKFTELTPKEQELASQALFSKNQGLVDMAALFKYLVNHIGDEQMIDPLTKQDALWSIVDMFTKNPQFFQASQLSQNDKLDVDSIAKFLGNQFDRGHSLEQLMKINRRLSQTSYGQQFQDSALQQVKEYQSNNQGQLPKSYNQRQLKQLYIKLRSSNQLNPNDELLLYLLKSANLNQEVIDYCSNHQHLSQVKQYYMSEALMQMEKSKKGSYEKALKDANILQGEVMSACQVTQGTKAVMLDRGAKAGIQFFDKHYASLQKQNVARENMLVSMYDSVFKDPSKVSKKQFKQTYLRSSLVASRLASESYAVHQMTQIIQGKDFNQIEALFSYYTLVSELRGFSKMGRILDPLVLEKRIAVEERISLMQHDLSRSDMQSVQNIAQAMDGKEIKVLNKQKQATVDHYLEMFKGMTLENVEEIRQKHTKIQAEMYVPDDVPSDIDDIEDVLEEDYENQFTDSEEAEYHDNRVPPSRFDEYADVEYDMTRSEEVDQVFQDFKDIFQKTVLDIADSAQTAIGRPNEEEIEDIATSGIMRTVNRFRTDDMRANSIRDFDDKVECLEADVLEFQDEFLNDAITTDNTSLQDPELLIGESFNHTMAEMKEFLLEALGKRKEQVLPVAVEIFNKIQSKQFKYQKIDDFQKFDDVWQVENIDDNLIKIRRLIDDPRSPVLSALLETESYITEAPRDFDDDEQRKFDKPSDYDNPLDMDKIQRDSERLENMSSEMGTIESSLEMIKKKLFGEMMKLDISETTPAQKTENKHKSAVKKLYKDWQNQEKGNDELSREQKLRFMRDALALQLGEQFTSSEFPVFYALDLISFGIQKKQPDAVRLGEKLLAEQGGRMPKTLATEVRNFLLDSKNQSQYRKGMKASGAHSASAIYHQTQVDDKNKPIFCMDDPYWQDFMAKNSRREDMWRTPSMLAWNHKPFGVIGEVVDTERLRQQYNKYYAAK